MNSGAYGFTGDRAVTPQTHQFWARALFAYKMPEREDYFSVNCTVGTSLCADRLSGYKLGAALPMSAEFPLSLPGYYFQEITARVVQFFIHRKFLRVVGKLKYKCTVT